MKKNEFQLIGRVSEITPEFKEDGLVITTVKIGVSTGRKNDEGKTIYDNYYISFFRERAEKIAEEVKEGEYIQIIGSLSMNKYTPKGEEKARYSIRLLGWGFHKVTYDSEHRRYVELEPQTHDEVVAEDEIPFC